MSCDGLVTNDQLINAGKDTNTMSEFVESNNPSTVSKSGKQIRTLQGINDDADNLISSLGGVDIGDYSSNLTLSSYNEYVVFDRAGATAGPSLWKAIPPRTPTPGTPLPYTIDSATYPDPTSDINIEPFSDINKDGAEQIAQEQAHAGDSQIVGEILPVDSTKSIENGQDATGAKVVRYLGGAFTTLTQFRMVKQDGTKTLLSGNITAINTTTAPYSAIVGSDAVWLGVDITGEQPEDGFYDDYFGLVNDGSVSYQSLIQDLADASYKLYIREESVIGLGGEVLFNNENTGIIGGTVKLTTDITLSIIQVHASGCKIQTTIDGNQKKGFGVVRVYSGSKRFSTDLITFKNFYGSDNTTAMIPFWLEVDNSEGFDIKHLHFENIKQLGNGSEGDLAGSLSLVSLSATQDNFIGGEIGTVTFDDVFCVDALGDEIREDADAVKTSGFKYTPITIGLIQGRNIGKRCLKTQGKGLECETINYTHTNTTLEHSAIVDFQDSDNHVNHIQGFGNIHSFCRMLARDGFQLERVGVSSGYGETSFIDPAPIASARGVLDIQAGKGVKFPSWNVKGGKLGLRIDMRGQPDIKDVEVNGTITAEYSHLIRNLNPGGTGGGIDDINLSGTFVSTANDLAPGSDVIVQSGGVIGTIKYLGGTTIRSEGTFDINARVRDCAALRIGAGATFESSDAISLEMINVAKNTLVGVAETAVDTGRSVIRLTDCGDGTISDVTGSKVTGTSEGMISVNGCSKLKFDSINNTSTGQDITFKDNGPTLNTGCFVDGSTRKVTAVSTYNETNLEWDGAPSYGLLAGAVNYVRRGYIFTDSGANKTYVWSGFNYVATTV